MNIEWNNIFALQKTNEFFGLGKKKESKISKEDFDKKYKNTMIHIHKECVKNVKLYVNEQKISKGVILHNSDIISDYYDIEIISYDCYKLKHLSIPIEERRKSNDLDSPNDPLEYVYKKYIEPIAGVISKTIESINGLDFTYYWDGDKYQDGEFILKCKHEVE